MTEQESKSYPYWNEYKDPAGNIVIAARFLGDVQDPEDSQALFMGLRAVHSTQDGRFRRWAPESLESGDWIVRDTNDVFVRSDGAFRSRYSPLKQAPGSLDELAKRRMKAQEKWALSNSTSTDALEFLATVPGIPEGVLRMIEQAVGNARELGKLEKEIYKLARSHKVLLPVVEGTHQEKVLELFDHVLKNAEERLLKLWGMNTAVRDVEAIALEAGIAKATSDDDKLATVYYASSLGELVKRLTLEIQALKVRGLEIQALEGRSQAATSLGTDPATSARDLFQLLRQRGWEYDPTAAVYLWKHSTTGRAARDLFEALSIERVW